MHQLLVYICETISMRGLIISCIDADENDIKQKMFNFV